VNLTGGTVLGGRYALGKRIAFGGMGEVWSATDTVLGRAVAVKLMHPVLGQDSDFVERFRAEARHTAVLAHPNIATVFDYGEDDGTAYLVMELVAGEPLSQIIAERAPLSAAETAAILVQAALALANAHEHGVVHRDVKPANILVTADGTAKLTDFGISRAADSVPLTRTGEVLGTAQYLSPEQALGQSATASSDIYALGVVGFEMLTGQRPFDTGSAVSTALAQISQPPPPLPETVPVAIRSVITAALAKDPADRPESAVALADALRMPGAAFPSAAPAASLASASTLRLSTAPSPTRAMPSPTEAMRASAMATPMRTRVTPKVAPSTRVTPNVPGSTRVMPTLAPSTRVMPTLAPGIPDRRSRRRRAWLLGSTAVVAVLGFLALSQLGGIGPASHQERNPATATTSTTAPPPPVATTVVAPLGVASPVPTQGNAGKGHADDRKKKGKQ